ncbi:MAG: hypothetical protein HWE39_21075 [Oceanospirillaceae bacterium]|nr:hypothetical protein [Oceanospirillaceae bacterium]
MIPSRDRIDADVPQQVMQPFEDYRDGIARDLLDALPPAAGPKRLLGPVLRHVLHFRFWQSLSEQALSDQEIRDLVLRWLHADGKRPTATQSAAEMLS